MGRLTEIEEHPRCPGSTTYDLLPLRSCTMASKRNTPRAGTRESIRKSKRTKRKMGGKMDMTRTREKARGEPSTAPKDTTKHKYAGKYKK